MKMEKSTQTAKDRRCNSTLEDTVCCRLYESPIGVMAVCGNRQGITLLEFDDLKKWREFGELTVSVNACLTQLDDYFTGKRTAFDVPLSPPGTLFQQKVWKALQEIPYGKTASYGQIAVRTSSPKGARAVGNANNHNLISIIIPCHRVIGSSGKLVGYAGGLWRKKWLLEHEKSNSN